MCVSMFLQVRKKDAVKSENKKYLTKKKKPRGQRKAASRHKLTTGWKIHKVVRLEAARWTQTAVRKSTSSRTAGKSKWQAEQSEERRQQHRSRAVRRALREEADSSTSDVVCGVVEVRGSLWSTTEVECSLQCSPAHMGPLVQLCQEASKAAEQISADVSVC